MKLWNASFILANKIYLSSNQLTLNRENRAYPNLWLTLYCTGYILKRRAEQEYSEQERKNNKIAINRKTRDTVFADKRSFRAGFCSSPHFILGFFHSFQNILSFLQIVQAWNHIIKPFRIEYHKEEGTYLR